MLDQTAPRLLPKSFLDWFAARGWAPRPHQLELLARAEAGQSALLIAPTGAGKTLAGFLPSLVELSAAPASRRALHTLYISPLKALSVDVARNLGTPVADLGLPIRVETRTGDTSASKRQRQRRDPPDILLTTPEQVALLLANPDAKTLFADLKRIVLDELHALVTSKRGDLLALDLARLRRIAPNVQTVGLSATVRDPEELRAYLTRRTDQPAALVVAPEGAAAEITMLDTRERLPWAGHGARHAIGEIYAALKGAKMALLFVNTRFQAEQLFWDLWRMNADNLPIALHHGSLDAGQRRKVEAAMAEGRLKAVVATATLDLGVDWGDVDLCINVGAPKGASRLIQRIGRANHRLDEPSRAVLIPANRFEVLECRAAIMAAAAGVQDTPVQRQGALDVLCQHILGMACAEPFDPDALYDEVLDAAPYADVSREVFDAAIDFVAYGGYALKAYERFAKIRRAKDGRWRVSNGRVAQQYRMNVGTIVEASMLKVRLVRGRAAAQAGGVPAFTGPVGRGGRVLGQIEDGFLETLLPGDTFMFGGEILALQAIVDDEALCSRSSSDTPKIPTYAGGKFPLSTYLAGQVRAMLSDPQAYDLPEQVEDWLALQSRKSVLPTRDAMLVETFPRGGRHYLVAYPFEGRLAHQTLGMLLTRRMERARLRPLGFVANDYAIAVWSMNDLSARIGKGLVSLEDLFAEDMLGDDLEDWLNESALMKRTFRICAVIAGLIERRFPGKEKTGKQTTVSTNLVYDVLRRHEPDHILLRAARADAATGLLDLKRLGELLWRIKGRIIHRALPRISPLAVPIMLEIGREPVYGEAQDAILAEAADVLIEEAREDDGDRGAAGGGGRRHSHVPVAGVDLLADVHGALFHEDERVLLVADLHLEKGSSLARRGILLPPYDTAATLAKLTAAVIRYAPRLVIALGDSFHDRLGAERLAAADRDTLARLQAGRDWVWLTGNHDPAPPTGLGGRTLAEWHLGPLTLRHEPALDCPPGEIAGHLHPVAIVMGRSGSVRRRCFVSDGRRCIMPAFGAYAGGLNFHHPAFAGLLMVGRRVAHALGQDRIYAVPEERCVAGV